MRHTFPAYPGVTSPQAEHVSVASTPLPGGARRFSMQSSQAQRDGGASQRVVDERPDAPRVQSPSALFDALFALALDDARLNSVDEIRDAAYNGGAPIACRCFQTGELWHYVWTRDLSYAAHLGLAWLDPQRSASSLLFKTSDWREGLAVPGLPEGSRQIVQDTGSGGSWPVSTDRVSWAWAAQSVLDNLADAPRRAFAQQALAALRGTVEADRVAAFDPRSGLYGGEQSFLDWRVQSYAPWITDQLARMAGSRSLSTNVGHLQALRLLARLEAELGHAAKASRYTEWAERLQAAIERGFWLDDVQQYASLTSDDSPPLALHKFDLLGTSLAVLAGVAPPQRAAEALARYPHGPFGAPVIAPQQPGVPVYHNRAIWPFVSAYALRAAAQVGNSAVAGHAFDSLWRAAALNLSNMENLEWLTAQPHFDDGPVINSRRQLWSVAAYLSAVAESVFGWRVTPQGLRIAPFLTTASRRALGDGAEARLSGLRWRDRRLDIVLQLPPLPAEAAGPAHYPFQSVTLNGRAVEGPISAEHLIDGVNRVDVRCGAPVVGDNRIARVPLVDPMDRTDPRVVAPDVPQQVSIGLEADAVVLRFAAPASREPLRFNVYRDGQAVARGLDTTTWTDLSARPGVVHVYAVEAVGTQSGHHSHLSAPVRLEGGAVQRMVLGDWFVRSTSGPVGLELLYDNHAHETQTGITNAVKLLRVLDAQGTEVARGVVQMPHVEPQDGQHPLRLSTLLRVTLPAGRYRAELLDFFNMSYLQANAHYGAAGGLSGPLNQADIAALQVLTLPDVP
ncbi:MGH1-like glycoside hydrolase domain-containing protein [Ideonella alba]|uniref:Esterase n=1 Tax=Ideonella alba TaxID=2824118 RepID=A0A941BNR5_9BURK|nr:esterase [Ideonella alba]MBQ0933619.1 esterase [Ideonella alba]